MTEPIKGPKRINPKTFPDAKMKALIKKQNREFFRLFRCEFLAKQTGIAYETVCCHKSRLKMSGEAAAAYCRIKEVKKAGFTKENLRPDIFDWGDVK